MRPHRITAAMKPTERATILNDSLSKIWDLVSPKIVSDSPPTAAVLLGRIGETRVWVADDDAVHYAILLIDSDGRGKWWELTLSELGATTVARKVHVEQLAVPTFTANQWNSSGSAELSYTHICGTVYADANAALGGVTVEHGPDGTSWDYVDNFSYASGDELFFDVALKGRYVRVGFLHNGSAPTTFRVSAYLYSTS